MLFTSFLIPVREEENVLRNRVRGQRATDTKGRTHDNDTGYATEEDRQERQAFLACVQPMTFDEYDRVGDEQQVEDPICVLGFVCGGLRHVLKEKSASTYAHVNGEHEQKRLEE